MTHFPVRYKPQLDFTNDPVKFEYYNVLGKEIADDIINIAVNYDGWQRGKSKSSYVEASFASTLLHDLSHPIYDILDKLWLRFSVEQGYDIEFVEYYEVKEYQVGDKFGLHGDIHGRVSETLDRKLNLIVQLSDSSTYTGGDLMVLNDTATRDLGTAIFFPSHYPHSVTPVTTGTRYSLVGHGWGKVYRK